MSALITYPSLFPVPTRRTGGYHLSAYGVTTYTALGMPAVTQVGTAFSGSTDNANLNLMHYQTGAVIGNVAGITGSYGAVRSGWAPRLSFSTVPVPGGSLTSCRWFVGLSDSDLSSFATLAASNGAKYVALRFDKGIGDTAWMLCSSDGTTASEVSTGITPTTSTLYNVTFDLTVSGTLTVIINGTVFTKTTNLPGAAVNLGVQATVTTLVAATRDIWFGSFVLEQNL